MNLFSLYRGLHADTPIALLALLAGTLDVCLLFVISVYFGRSHAAFQCTEANSIV